MEIKRKGDCGGEPRVGNKGDPKPRGMGRGIGGQGRGLGRGPGKRLGLGRNRKIGGGVE